MIEVKDKLKRPIFKDDNIFNNETTNNNISIPPFRIVYPLIEKIEDLNNTNIVLKKPVFSHNNSLKKSIHFRKHKIKNKKSQKNQKIQTKMMY